jgi:hypothetical protein
MATPTHKSVPTAPASASPEHRRRHRMLMVRADLQRVARLCGLPDGEAPTYAQYHQHGRYPVSRAEKIAGAESWSPAMRRYGLGTARQWRKIPAKELVADLRRVAMRVGRPQYMPSRKEYRAQGQWGPDVVELRLSEGSSWRECAAMAGLIYREGHCIAPTDEQVLADYREACAAHGVKPGEMGISQGKFRTWLDGRYSLSPCRRIGGGWNGFVTRAGFAAYPPKRKDQRSTARVRKAA